MNKPTTILFDAERMKYPHTGLFYFCKQLAQSLITKAAAANIRVQLFLPSSQQQHFTADTKILPIQFWYKYHLPIFKEVDIWHTTSQDSAYFPFHFKKPIVFTIHDLNYYHDERKSMTKRNNWLKQLQKKVDASSHIVFISAYTAKDVQAHINLQGKPFSIIYNGCNFNETILPTIPIHVPKGPFIFSIGTIAVKKNFHVLPTLLANNQMQLIIAGITQQPRYVEQIIAEAKKWGVENRLIFAGAISENDKQWYYANCSAFVFPSLSEGFGLPLVEAMHFGKPVFISNATSLPEIGGDVAYIFPDFNPQNMQAVFAAGMKDFEENNRAEKIIARASLFNWDEAAHAYLNIYQQLA
ncbi:glycosyltransferase family 4 protein [Sediminibacterium sp.]|uniref:glycosyltransferase family 4 protein n=1 Tax=Sediminibacterium sp. TaxID=1917865 RepID=UPI003F711BF5